MKFLALFPAKFSDLIDRTLKITQNTRRRGRSLRQCAQFRVFCSAACKTCACCGQMCGLGGRFFRPAARRAGFLQEAEEKAAEKGSPPRGAGAKRLRGCMETGLPVSRRLDGELFCISQAVFYRILSQDTTPIKDFVVLWAVLHYTVVILSLFIGGILDGSEGKMRPSGRQRRHCRL